MRRQNPARSRTRSQARPVKHVRSTRGQAHGRSRTRRCGQAHTVQQARSTTRGQAHAKNHAASQPGPRGQAHAVTHTRSTTRVQASRKARSMTRGQARPPAREPRSSTRGHNTGSLIFARCPHTKKRDADAASKHRGPLLLGMGMGITTVIQSLKRVWPTHSMGKKTFTMKQKNSFENNEADTSKYIYTWLQPTYFDPSISRSLQI